MAPRCSLARHSQATYNLNVFSGTLGRGSVLLLDSAKWPFRAAAKLSEDRHNLMYIVGFRGGSNQNIDEHWFEGPCSDQGKLIGDTAAYR